MKPILFNTDMVRAILGDRKTVTRRAMKPQPIFNEVESGTPVKCEDGSWCFKIDQYDNIYDFYRKPPYQPGDILYVRETWCFEPKSANGYGYKANILAVSDGPWYPSIHMPKAAARLFLKVTNVRAERIQDITEEQALAEGVPDSSDYPISPVYCPRCKGEGLIGALHPVSLGYMEVECPDCKKSVDRFKNLWDSTVNPADRNRYGWAANPWVWAIEFEQISKEEALSYE